MPDECGPGDGGCTGRVGHADPTCASASVAGAPVLVPLLLPDVGECFEPADVGTSPFGSGPDGGRVPPSLSELQLLRIWTVPRVAACLADAAPCLGMPFTDPNTGAQP
ncbi:DUF6153 family protein [Streptomyces sp. NPDC001100]